MQKPSMVRVACDTNEAVEEVIDLFDKNAVTWHLLSMWPERLLQTLTYSIIE